MQAWCDIRTNKLPLTLTVISELNLSDIHDSHHRVSLSRIPLRDLNNCCRPALGAWRVRAPPRHGPFIEGMTQVHHPSQRQRSALCWHSHVSWRRARKPVKPPDPSPPPNPTRRGVRHGYEPPRVQSSGIKLITVDRESRSAETGAQRCTILDDVPPHGSAPPPRAALGSFLQPGTFSPSIHGLGASSLPVPLVMIVASAATHGSTRTLPIRTSLRSLAI